MKFSTQVIYIRKGSKLIPVKSGGTGSKQYSKELNTERNLCILKLSIIVNRHEGKVEKQAFSNSLHKYLHKRHFLRLFGLWHVLFSR